jgi:hypothetical protein
MTQALAADFTQAARRYLEAVDAREAGSAEDFLLALHPLLCELTFRASVLPDVELEDDDGEEDERQDAPAPGGSSRWFAMWEPLYDSLKDFLGSYNLHWEVFDPIELGHDDPMRRSLADDLAHIYCDLTEALALAPPADGDVPVDVIWQWRFDFFSTWGHSAVDAIRAIHAYISYHQLGEEDTADEVDDDNLREGA